MSAIKNIPGEGSHQIFYTNGATWQVWNKPKNANFVYFYVLGGGSGGGGGRTTALNSAPGGGGGASSAVTIALFPTVSLPDTLYLYVGQGGTGGAANTNGVVGQLSYISFQPNTASINILLQSGNAVPTAGGGASSTTIPGNGGTAGTVWTFATAINGNLGLINTEPGHAGSGGTSTGGSFINLTPTSPVVGATGGGTCSAGGVPFAGGSIVGSGFLLTIPPGVANAADSSINGLDGYTSIPNLQSMSIPMFFTGGTGGAVATTSGRAGGRGGNGSFGCGGGGGGGAYSGTGGAGGNGGGGLILINCL